MMKQKSISKADLSNSKVEIKRVEGERIKTQVKEKLPNYAPAAVADCGIPA